MEELLLEWHNNLPEVVPEMSLKNQAKYLSKKYKVEEHTIKKSVYIDNTGETEYQETKAHLVRFKDIICKYRPHLHMGDYWLDVTIVDGVATYKFYYIVEGADSPLVLTAQHPHLSGGVPCLGSFQGDLQTAFSENNFVQFFSIMKAYLSAYNGRSTYLRGSAYKKKNLVPQLHSYNEICEIFNDEQNDNFDIYGVAQDPMRWNWPKDLTAWSKIEISGQDNTVLTDYFQFSQYPYLKQIRVNAMMDFNFDKDAPASKILGYVYLAMELGELSLYQAFEFVRVFLLALQAQYEGINDEHVKVKLRKLATDIYSTHANNKYHVNARYSISLDAERRELVADLSHITRRYRRNSDRNEDRDFIKNLKWAGHKVSNFMILLRKRTPDIAAASTYLSNLSESVDINDVEQKYNKVKKFAYNLALQQLEKDRRKFINEINRPEISNIVGDDGQGTLFSGNL